MFASDKRYLSFSLNEGTIKLAQATSAGVVEKIARTTVSDANPDTAAAALKTLLNGFNRQASVICLVPASVATSKTIEVPSADPQEIKSIINLQVSRHTPYSREEVLIGYINLGAGSANNTKVLLVIVHRNVVKERLTILEKAGLSVEKISFIPEGVGRLYSKGLNLRKDSPPVGVIDFGVNAVNFLVVARGSVIFSRNIHMDIHAITGNQEAQAKFLEEISKSIAAYASEESDVAIASYVATSDQELFKQILPSIKAHLKTDVAISPYINYIKSGGIKNRIQKDFADDSFLDCIAPIITASKNEVNLMPDEMVVKKSIEKQSQEAIKTVVAVLIILLLLGATIMSRIYFNGTYLNKNLRAEYAAQKEEVQKLQEQYKKVKLVKQYVQGRMVSLDLIQELYRVTPKEIYLNTIVLGEDGTVTISGISESMSQVFSYVKALSDSTMFTNVKTKNTATKKDNGKDVASFELTLQVQEYPKE